jgi:hypothetical protein
MRIRLMTPNSFMSPVHDEDCLHHRHCRRILLDWRLVIHDVSLQQHVHDFVLGLHGLRLLDLDVERWR